MYIDIHLDMHIYIHITIYIDIHIMYIDIYMHVHMHTTWTKIVNSGFCASLMMIESGDDSLPSHQFLL